MPPATSEIEYAIANAFRVRDLTITRRLALGERVVGAKVVHLDRPRVGWITDGMVRSEPIIDGTLVRPRAELKLALRLGVAVEGPIAGIGPLLAGADGLFLCLDVVDSRSVRGAARARDAVADNCSTAAFVVCDEVLVPELASRGCESSVLWLAQRLLAERGALEAGTLLVSTPIGVALPLAIGTRVGADLAHRMFEGVA